ncbi:MAG: HAD-IB family phosphatase [Magnetococcales bacterium]|nr:HAD-IB family phosphatase [Magnetococcales bacterium]MBF0115315.1 HAD-IB family phosphatase [Magnetococcales bacterium]
MAQNASMSLLQRFALPEWRAVEKEWHAGHLTARAAMQQQVSLMRMSADALEQFVDQVPIEPGFVDFVQSVAKQGWALCVVSDGLDVVIQRVLQRHGLAHLPVFANQLHRLSDGCYQLNFPHGSSTCRSGSGTCKCAVAARQQGSSAVRPILIGDGCSDYCLAHEVYEVWAKDHLLSYCQEKGLPHWTLSSFAAADARVQDPQWLQRAWPVNRF